MVPPTVVAPSPKRFKISQLLEKQPIFRLIDIKSWSAVQMKGSKTIQADQMAENEIFGQIDQQNGPMNH